MAFYHIIFLYLKCSYEKFFNILGSVPILTKSCTNSRSTSVLFTAPLIRFKSYKHNKVDESSNVYTEETERNQQNKKSWKMMKYTFAVLGASISIASLTLAYEILKPNYDADGKIIEDEYSNLPFYYQLYHRMKKELSYYKKVKPKFLIHEVLIYYVNVDFSCFIED